MPSPVDMRACAIFARACAHDTLSDAIVGESFRFWVAVFFEGAGRGAVWRWRTVKDGSAALVVRGSGDAAVLPLRVRLRPAEGVVAQIAQLRVRPRTRAVETLKPPVGLAGPAVDSQRRELVQPMPVWIPCLEQQGRVRRGVRRARAVGKLPEPKGRRLLRHVAKALTGLAARARAFAVVFGDAELREWRHGHLCGYVCVCVYVYVYTHTHTDTY